MEGNYCKNIELLYNSVDFNLFKQPFSKEEKNSLRHKMGFTSTDFIVMYSGRIQEYKGVRQLLEAICQLKNIPRIKLLIVGSHFFSSSKKSSFEKSLFSLTEQIKWKVVFTGYIDYKDMYKYYNLADLCVFPSTWEEPFALTCLEALICGKPVVITKSGGMVEVVDEKCAKIVPNDLNLSDNLARTIKELYNNNNELLRMSNAAKKRAEYFSSQKQFERFTSLINKYI